MYVCGEGGSGGRQGEKEWWEGDRRERENGEKQGGGDRREDDQWGKQPYYRPAKGYLIN